MSTLLEFARPVFIGTQPTRALWDALQEADLEETRLMMRQDDCPNFSRGYHEVAAQLEAVQRRQAAIVDVLKARMHAATEGVDLYALAERLS
jgi:hypothetical protein